MDYLFDNSGVLYGRAVTSTDNEIVEEEYSSDEELCDWDSDDTDIENISSDSESDAEIHEVENEQQPEAEPDEEFSVE